MLKVTFYPNAISVDVPEGVSLLEASRRAGVPIESPCNGTGTCGKCKVKIRNKSIDQNGLEFPIFENSNLDESDYVLSCEVSVKRDIEIEIPEGKNSTLLKIIDTGLSAGGILKPNIKKRYNSVIKKTEVTFGDKGIHFEEGDSVDKIYGIVIDIGTTTLVASLVNLLKGEELARTSALNPQSLHAHDVLSRISLASDANGLKMLYELIVNEINSMIHACVAMATVNPDYIYEIVYSGNTTMLYLAINKDPSSLGLFPYVNTLKGDEFVNADLVGLKINNHARVYLPPVISAYVGADISSGIIATKLYENAGIVLLIDIGTNGEMVLSVNGTLTATSTAAGPAFEGMTIANGMRANDGAIERFSIEEDGTVTIKTIGNTRAIGICGSGLVDAVGELVRTGVIQGSGKFADKITSLISIELTQKIEKIENRSLFRLAEKVVLTQKDIRQVQLAKAAIRTGIDFLLLQSGITPQQVDLVYIAGSFGYHLKEDALLNTGLIPADFRGKLEFIGNTSLSGGKTFLENIDSRKRLSEEVLKVRNVDLARLNGFQDAFVKNMKFPEGI